MPRGDYVRETVKVHCKRCQDTPGFKSISELRKHQWAEHREYYKNTLTTVSRMRKKPNGSNTQVLDLVRSLDVQTVSLQGIHHEMTVTDAIKMLEARYTFMGDVISLLKGLQNGG